MPKFLRNLLGSSELLLCGCIIALFITGYPLIDILTHICMIESVSLFTVAIIVFWLIILTFISIIAFYEAWEELFDKRK